VYNTDVLTNCWHVMFRRGYVYLELSNLSGGLYNIRPCTFYPNQEAPFFLNISSTCPASVSAVSWLPDSLSDFSAVNLLLLCSLCCVLLFIGHCFLCLAVWNVIFLVFRHRTNFPRLCFIYLFSVLWHCWLSGRKGIRPVTTEWWGTGVVICLERGANDLHMVQLMSLPPHHFLLHSNPTFLMLMTMIGVNGWMFLVVPAHPGCPGQNP